MQKLRALPFRCQRAPQRRPTGLWRKSFQNDLPDWVRFSSFAERRVPDDKDTNARFRLTEKTNRPLVRTRGYFQMSQIPICEELTGGRAIRPTHAAPPSHQSNQRQYICHRATRRRNWRSTSPATAVPLVLNSDPLSTTLRIRLGYAGPRKITSCHPARRSPVSSSGRPTGEPTPQMVFAAHLIGCVSKPYHSSCLPK